jgi:hypothetical protein
MSEPVQMLAEIVRFQSPLPPESVTPTKLTTSGTPHRIVIVAGLPTNTREPLLASLQMTIVSPLRDQWKRVYSGCLAWTLKRRFRLRTHSGAG